MAVACGVTLLNQGGVGRGRAAVDTPRLQQSPVKAALPGVLLHFRRGQSISQSDTQNELQPPMNQPTRHMLTSAELAQRWGRSESAICLATVVGVGPRFVKSTGMVLFPLEEIQRYERESAVLKPFKVLH